MGEEFIYQGLYYTKIGETEAAIGRKRGLRQPMKYTMIHWF